MSTLTQSPFYANVYFGGSINVNFNNLDLFSNIPALTIIMRNFVFCTNNYELPVFQQTGARYGGLQDDSLAINKDFASDGMQFLFLFDRLFPTGELILPNLDHKEDARLARADFEGVKARLNTSAALKTVPPCS
eukprot:7273384-Heterocapsa_arctica.AAC.1